VRLTFNAAWYLCEKFNKPMPNRGYGRDLTDELFLVATKHGKYVLIDFPVTPEKVAFAANNEKLIKRAPTSDPVKLLALIRS
jgi:hypothetical protein